MKNIFKLVFGFMLLFQCDAMFAQYVEVDSSETTEEKYPLVKNDFELIRKIKSTDDKGLIYTKSTGEIQVNKPSVKEKTFSFDGKEVE